MNLLYENAIDSYYLSSINPVFNMRITYTKEDMASRVCMTSLPPRCKADR